MLDRMNAVWLSCLHDCGRHWELQNTRWHQKSSAPLLQNTLESYLLHMCSSTILAVSRCCKPIAASACIQGCLLPLLKFPKIQSFLVWNQNFYTQPKICRAVPKCHSPIYPLRYCSWTNSILLHKVWGRDEMGWDWRGEGLKQQLILRFDVNPLSTGFSHKVVSQV